MSHSVAPIRHRVSARAASRPTESMAEPFDDAEAAWFWCVQAQVARQAGARVARGVGQVLRPCEPLDILAVVERLERAGALRPPHMRVLRAYGPGLLRPCPLRAPRDAQAWEGALAALAPALRAKGIVR